MSGSKILMLVTLLLVVVVFAPVLPTSGIFGWSASLYDVDDVHDAVRSSEDDVAAIIELVSSHLFLGSDSRYPPQLSLKQYLFDFENVGFEAIGLMPLGFEDGCPDCSAAAFASVTRNSIDIASAMYFLAKVGEAWQIREVRDGVTGTPANDG